MKIAFLNDGLYAYASKAPSAVGGAERQQWLLARALAANGWSVTVGVRGAMAVGQSCTIDKVEFVGMNQGHILLDWYRLLSSQRPDWWYWRCADHLLGPAVEVAKLAGARTIFAVALDRDVQPRHALFRRPRLWLLYAWGLSRTDRIFVQHGGQLSQLAPRWRAKACILPSIVSEQAPMKPHAERGEYVAWVAMLRQVKRPDLLIEIARKVPSLRFVVCGGPTTFRSPPGYGEQIVGALQAVPNIEYLGQIAPEMAQQVIANAAILLSTSDEEGFPNTFLQAWSSGTPVVTLKIDPDAIIEKMGLGVVAGSVEGANAALCTLINSPWQREEIGIHARRYVDEAHSEAAVTRVFECSVRNVA